MAADEAGWASGVSPRGSDDVGRRHAGNQCGTVRRPVRDPFRQCVEPVAPTRNKILVVTVLGDHHPHHRQRDRGIRPRFRLQPDIRDLRRRGAERIDHDDLRTAGLGALDLLPLDRISGDRVAANDQDAVAVVDIISIGDRQPRHLVKIGSHHRGPD